MHDQYRPGDAAATLLQFSDEPGSLRREMRWRNYRFIRNLSRFAAFPCACHIFISCRTPFDRRFVRATDDEGKLVSHATDVESPLTPNRCDYFALLSRVLPENALCRCEVSLFWWQVRAALRHVPGKPSIPISNVFASPSDIRVLMQAS